MVTAICATSIFVELIYGRGLTLVPFARSTLAIVAECGPLRGMKGPCSNRTCICIDLLRKDFYGISVSNLASA